MVFATSTISIKQTLDAFKYIPDSFWGAPHGLRGPGPEK